MKKEKRKLQLERITLRPLAPRQLLQVQGGDGRFTDECVSKECETPSITQNYSNRTDC